MLINYLRKPILFVLLLGLFEEVYPSQCPDQKYFSPCTCEDWNLHPDMRSSIVCDQGKLKDGHLEGIFESIKRNTDVRYFESIKIQNNPDVITISDGTFADFLFNWIVIRNNSNLVRIGKNAFGRFQNTTYEFHIEENPKLGSEPGATADLFLAMSRLNNLRTLTLNNNGIDEIPDNAFQPRDSSHTLFTLYFGGQSIKKIGNDVFYKLNNLNSISFARTSIDYYPENAFRFEKLTTLSRGFFLTFYGPEIPKFADNCLTKIYPKVEISLQIKEGKLFLDEKVFKPYLDASPDHQISLVWSVVDCKDSRNNWWKNSDYQERVIGWKC